jgi:alkylation response protein AidB-like acyl-CoA dehydrogenase
MKFSFSGEQEAFRESLRGYLGERSGTREVRRLMESEAGWEREGWARLNAEMGLAAVRIPEAYGGQGFGFSEQCIVMEEMGRVLLCAPYFASAVLAAGAILQAGTEAQKAALLPGIASGDVVGTLAWVEDSGRWDAEGTTLSAVRDGAGWRLDGHKSFVIDGHTADLVVVLGRTAAGLSLFTVEGAAVSRRAVQGIDPTRKLARLEFAGVKAELLGEDGGAAGPFGRVMTEAAVCLANEMVGGAERLREDALAYAKMRMQFGKSIAGFQSMKHKQADMLMEVELAKSAAYYAAAALDEGDADVTVAAAIAKAAASEAYLQTAIHAVQIHGGIGFTWDNDTHLWFKRAKASEVMLGDATLHRERMMQAMVESA